MYREILEERLLLFGLGPYSQLNVFPTKSKWARRALSGARPTIPSIPGRLSGGGAFTRSTDPSPFFAPKTTSGSTACFAGNRPPMVTPVGRPAILRAGTCCFEAPQRYLT